MADIHLPDGVRLEPGAGGLERLAIAHDAGMAELYLHGAHLTAWKPRGRAPVLWVSPLSPFASGKAIRGGVPVCFPWFGAKAGDPGAPAHGPARLVAWAIDGAERTPSHTRVDLVLGSDAVPAHGSRWTARYRVEVGEQLGVSLAIANDGEGAFTFEEALHTYYAVADAREAAVSGLEHVEYLDKPAGFARVRQDGAPIRFGTEVDRVYLATSAECVIDDPVWRRRIHVAKTNSDTTVVWNPGPVRGAAMPEVAEGWTRMVCVETCNVGPHAVTLAPGGRHTMSARVRVEERS